MGKTVFLFPGQGAQYLGMGKEFYEEFPVYRQILDQASQVTGLDLFKICTAEEEKLHETQYTQIAMLAVEAGILQVAKEQGIQADFCAGLSLGEYGALLAAGAMKREDAFRVVRERGILMEEAYPTGGAMAAVMGTDASVIEEICKETEGAVSIANYNCPGQIVITGEKHAVEKAEEKLKARGTRRILLLNVSGPFHSKLLMEAGEKLKEVIHEISFLDLQIPYVTNVTGEFIKDKKKIPELLVTQISSPVRWQQSIETMIREGADTFIEIGPGRTLSGFLRKINPNMTVFHIEKPENLEQVKEYLRC